MSFHIDRQTREELNLDGKYRKDSIFSLFNTAKSHGGASLLNELFHHPLDSETAINQRSRTIQFFQGLDLVFPFDPKQLNDAREYLDSTTQPNQLLHFADLLKKKMLSAFVHDTRLTKTIQGVHASIGMLKACEVLVASLPSAPTDFQARAVHVQKILGNPMIQTLENVDIYRAISLRDLARYDYFLRVRFRHEMEALMQFIYEVDVFIAVSQVARTRGFTYAEAKVPDANLYYAENLKHPALPEAVGNTFSLGEQENLLFLTGANMAGKSTLMKSLGIGLYLAHLGFPVPADKLVFSVREGLYTSINTADNIGLGYSHFYAEVMRVKEAALAVSRGKRLFLIFDELFKGTNVKDAYDGTLAVTEAFSAYRKSLFVISTHIIEVGHALERHPNIQFSYMPTLMQGERPQYTYKLQTGITEDRQGMIIIRNEGILDLFYGARLQRM